MNGVMGSIGRHAGRHCLTSQRRTSPWRRVAVRMIGAGSGVGHKPVLRLRDACMVGLASGIGGTAMAAPVLAAKPLSQSAGVPAWAILVAGEAAPIALCHVLRLLMRRGGMLGRRGVIGLWALAASGVAGLAVLPDRLGWAFPSVAAGCMAAVGAGVACGYLVQANMLAKVRDGAHRRSRSQANLSTSAAGEATGLAQRWTLISGVVTTLLLGFGMARFGVRPALAGLACLVAAFAALHRIWDGLPEAQAGRGRGGFWATVRQRPEVRRDVAGTFFLYAAWGALYPVVALLGAGPIAQAWVSGLARGVAAVLVGWFGRMADRNPRLAALMGGICATAGVLVLALFGPVSGWLPGGSGVVLAEIGFNGVAGRLKGSLADARDVRTIMVGYIARFAGFGLSPLLLSLSWGYRGMLMRNIATLVRLVVDHDASRVLPLLIAVMLVPVLVKVPRDVLEAGTYPIKAIGNGKLVLGMLAQSRDATATWVYVGVPGNPRRAIVNEHGRIHQPKGQRLYTLRRGEWLEVAVRIDGSTCQLLNLCCRAPVRGRHAEIARRSFVPLAGAPWLPNRGLPISSFRRDDSHRIGKLVAFASEAVSATTSVCRIQDLPQLLREDLEHEIDHLPGDKKADLDRDGWIVLYTLSSDVFRGKLRIRPHLRPRRRGTTQSR